MGGGFGVWGLGFRVQGRFRVRRIKAWRPRPQDGVGFSPISIRVQGLGIRVQDSHLLLVVPEQQTS